MTIRSSHLCYTYRSRPEPALVDVTAEFRPGEITLIAGASGCGKTTLIRCINGLIPNSYANGQLSGTVTLFDQDNSLLALSDISQIVGTVLQDPERQIIASQVFNEIAFGLENLALNRNEIMGRVKTVAQLLHIDHLLERETFTLSGGEKQKVALAGVLVMRPKALLLDEPLASLDPESGHEALLMMRELADSGIAVVIVEHRVEDVLTVSPEHCIYMTNGGISYDGDGEGLVQAVDWRQVKLPAPAVIQRIRRESAGMAGTEQLSQTTYPVNVDQKPLLEFRHVHFHYGDGPEVLHDVSFAIKPGDRIALLGPNGAGKSTLAKHAIGLNKPTRGEVFIDDRVARNLSVAQMARTVGFVFQSPSHMLFAPTVREELAFGPRNIGLDSRAIDQNVRHALEMVNLPGYLDYSPLALSFGQQKRISIASVLAMDPRVLVMDEPSAGQDYANYSHLMNDLGSHLDASTVGYAIQFAALLFITHDLDLAIAYANRVLLLAAGRIIADGPPERVLQDDTKLAQCRIRSTSLLEVNRSLLPRTGRFLPANRLADFAA